MTGPMAAPSGHSTSAKGASSVPRTSMAFTKRSSVLAKLNTTCSAMPSRRNASNMPNDCSTAYPGGAAKRPSLSSSWSTTTLMMTAWLSSSCASGGRCRYRPRHTNSCVVVMAKTLTSVRVPVRWNSDHSRVVLPVMVSSFRRSVSAHMRPNARSKSMGGWPLITRPGGCTVKPMVLSPQLCPTYASPPYTAPLSKRRQSPPMPSATRGGSGHWYGRGSASPTLLLSRRSALPPTASAPAMRDPESVKSKSSSTKAE
mmetsp:Transcript_27375/g.94740  ORF Transcript_27375/g.94740 Transcript_27375/m.94740 type:complete len:257 (-) Transcript_27375:108-878(-)